MFFVFRSPQIVHTHFMEFGYRKKKPHKIKERELYVLKKFEKEKKTTKIISFKLFFLMIKNMHKQFNCAIGLKHLIDLNSIAYLFCFYIKLNMCTIPIKQTNSQENSPILFIHPQKSISNQTNQIAKFVVFLAVK